MGVDRVREMRLMSLLMRPDRRAVNDRRALAKTRNRRRGGRFPQRAHRRAARTRGARADETPPRIRARRRGFFFDVVVALAAVATPPRRALVSRSRTPRTPRATPPRVTMSLVAQSRRHLVRWATRAAVRPMAIIPESHQVKEKKDAQRVDFFGDQQAIDSRCVRTTTRAYVAIHRKRRPPARRMRWRTSSGTGGANLPEPPGAVPPVATKRREIEPANDHEPNKIRVS